jgi:hypothetical protein
MVVCWREGDFPTAISRATSTVPLSQHKGIGGASLAPALHVVVQTACDAGPLSSGRNAPNQLI